MYDCIVVLFNTIVAFQHIRTWKHQ